MDNGYINSNWDSLSKSLQQLFLRSCPAYKMFKIVFLQSGHFAKTGIKCGEFNKWREYVRSDESSGQNRNLGGSSISLGLTRTNTGIDNARMTRAKNGRFSVVVQF